MNLAYYYHLPAVIQDKKAKLPGFLGVFIDALAREVDELHLLVHEAKSQETGNCDYELHAENIRIINLGFKTPAWHRELFHRFLLPSALKSISNCEALIVRAPTPLASYFYKYLNHTRLWYMIVGDYLEAIDHYKTSNFRDKLIYYYLHINDYFFQKRIRRTDILVNSPALFKKYQDKAKSIHLIRTTTLSETDFFRREDTCLAPTIALLYTGQFSPAKGLYELLDAIIQLSEEGLSLNLHLVGWEDDPAGPVQKAIRAKANQNHINDKVIFHGKKKVGADLNAMYRMADIYVIPSHHEGFPRTIWEAMANSLPVIATEVGGIPDTLTHLENAYLIPPKSIESIASAIKRVVNDPALRQKLIQCGFALAQENTLQIQTKKLVDIIKRS